MPRIQTIDDLARRRNEAVRGLKIRLEAPATIRVGMGRCGVAAGARETMLAILDELAHRQIEAHVMPMDCIGDCAREPLVEVVLSGQPPVTYANVQPLMVPKMVEEHLVKGQPVKEWMRARPGRLEDW